MRLILRRVWQRTLVLEDVAKITAVDPATTGSAADEVLSFVLRGIAERLTDVLTARDHVSQAPAP
jgi:hypothetical protein